MKKLPAIILTSRFSTPTSHHAYGKYLGYIARKEALEAKEYLSETEKKELAQVDERINSLNEKNNFEFKEQGNSDRQKSAQKILHEKEFYNLNDAEFDKYLGYMIRKEALNKKANEGGLNSEEREELVKVNTAAKKIGEVRSTKEKVLDGVFSSDKDLVQLKDMDYIRKQLNQAQKKGSVLWQDVISFDNEFLKKQKILDAQTGILNEDEIQKATKKMQDVFEKEMDPPLNQMYWVASIHRNTDNVHIHIATVEREPRRQSIERNGQKQPKGRRKQSTIDHMKSSFANELIGTNELTKILSIERQNIRKAVQKNLATNIINEDFQKEINRFMSTLPTSRREWNYNKLNSSQQKSLNKIVDHLLSDNKDFQDWKNNVLKMQETRVALYGKSKRNTKNYASNQMYGKEGIYARNGNALLHDLRELDKKANGNQRHRINLKDKVRPEQYVQSVLNEVQSKAKNYKNNSRKHAKEQNKATNRPKHLPRITKKQLQKIASNQEKVWEKQHVDFKTRKALREYEKMQRAVEHDLDNI